jgi:hypothetical protein
MGKKRPEEEYAFLSIKVERFDFAVGEALNVDLRTRRAWELSDDDSVVTPVMRIEMVGTAIYPEERLNDIYNITIYEDSSGRYHPMLKDIQARDKEGHFVYRKCRDIQVPVYTPSPGAAVVQKIRGTREWQTCLWVARGTASDFLTVLNGSSRQLYVFIHERKVARLRWVVELTLQTTDPANS